jgi:hypothetical protein
MTKSFQHAFIAIFAVMAVHAVLLYLHAYSVWPDIDVPMHFSGGFAMGLLALAIFSAGHAKSKGQGSHAWYIKPLFVVGFVALVAVLWEFHEFLLDVWFVQNGSWEKTQISLADTMGDLFFGLLGGLAALWIRISRVS